MTLDFLFVDNWMTQYAVKRLATYYADHPELFETNHAHDFWNGRLISYRDADPVIRALMIRWLNMMAIPLVKNHYGVTQPLYPDVLHLVGWPPGSEMPVHADNTQLDGSSNGLEHRAYSGVYYLTGGDDGALTLPDQGIKVMPRPGRFVSLPCGLSHRHGVERTSTLRVTMAFFLTFDRDRADPNLI